MHSDIDAAYQRYCEDPYTKRLQTTLTQMLQQSLDELMKTSDLALSERAKGKIAAVQHVLQLPDLFHEEFRQEAGTSQED